MGFSDSRFNAREHYTKKLVEEIRMLVAHPDGFCPDEGILIFSIEHLINVAVLLDENGFITSLPKMEEVLGWKKKFVVKFEAWAGNDVYTDLLASFDRLMQRCEYQD